VKRLVLDEEINSIDTEIAISLLVIGAVALTGIAYSLSTYTEYSLLNWISVFGTIGSLLLSSLLALLYLNMSRIQERQMSLMEHKQRIEYSSDVEIEDWEITNDEVELTLTNTGRGKARGLSVSLDIEEPPPVVERTKPGKSVLSQILDDGERISRSSLGPQKESRKFRGTPSTRYDQETHESVLPLSILAHELDDIDEEIRIRLVLHFSDHASEEEKVREITKYPLVAEISNGDNLEDIKNR